jgi:hypothetical protein
LVEVVDRETGYVPARPLEQMNAHQIFQALRAGQGVEPATRPDPLLETVRGECDRIRQAEQAVASAVTLRDLVGGTAPSQSPSGTVPHEPVPPGGPIYTRP